MYYYDNSRQAIRKKLPYFFPRLLYSAVLFLLPMIYFCLLYLKRLNVWIVMLSTLVLSYHCCGDSHDIKDDHISANCNESPQTYFS